MKKIIATVAAALLCISGFAQGKEYLASLFGIKSNGLIDNTTSIQKAIDFIAEKGWDDQFGARPLKRAIQKYVEDVLAEEIIQHPCEPGSTILIDLDEERQEISIHISSNAPKEIEAPVENA